MSRELEPQPGEQRTGTVSPPAPPPPAPSGPVHTSHRETVERHYERAREAGIPRDNARRIAEDAATRNHRVWDQRRRER